MLILTHSQSTHSGDTTIIATLILLIIIEEEEEEETWSFTPRQPLRLYQGEEEEEDEEDEDEEEEERNMRKARISNIKIEPGTQNRIQI